MTFGLEMSVMMHDIYYLFDNILSDSTIILECECIMLRTILRNINHYIDINAKNIFSTKIQRSEINETFIFTTLPALYTIQLMPYLPHLS